MSRRGRTVPIPPVPSDPTVCQWCTGQKERGLCTSGCAPTNQPTHTKTCEECGGQFQTGEKFAIEQCWRCREVEAARANRIERHSGRPVTGWLKDRQLTSAIARDAREGLLPKAPALDLGEKGGA